MNIIDAAPYSSKCSGAVIWLSASHMHDVGYTTKVLRGSFGCGGICWPSLYRTHLQLVPRARFTDAALEGANRGNDRRGSRELLYHPLPLLY